MSTLNSLPLWSALGIFGVAVPIIIHLLYRKHKRTTDWAAMELLRKAMVIRSGQVRLEDYLILFLRCLALALLAAALLRPTLSTDSAVLGSGKRVGVAIAIDASYSMGHGKFNSRFDRARDITRDILASLTLGDPATIALCGERPRILLRGTGYEPSRFNDVLDEATVLPERLNLASTLTELETLVAELKTPIRECYLITDAQVLNWQSLSDDERARLERLASLATVFVIPVGGDGEENLSVTALNYVSGGLRRGETARFEAEVRNNGRQQVEGGNLTFHLDGQPIARQAIGLIGAGQTRGMSFYAAFENPGPAAVDVRLSADELKLDNIRHAAVQVRERVRVLCVDGEPSGEPGEGETWFLERALRLKQVGDDPVLDVLRTETADFAAENLNDFDIVILANVGDPGAQAGERLDAFVRRGGGLIVFGGDRVDTDLYNERLRVLPATLDEPLLAEDDANFAIVTTDTDHPLADLPRRIPAELLDEVRLTGLLQATPKPDASVLLRAQDTPLLIERGLGAGRVLLCTTSADLEWGRLAIHPLYIILMQQAVTHLSSEPSRGQALIGQPARLDASSQTAGKRVAVAGPDGVSQEIRVSDDRVLVFEPELPGIYASDESAVAVNIDAGEADVKALDSAALQGQVEPTGARLVAAADLAGAIESSRVGRELAKLLIVLALLVLVLQSWLAKRFTARMREGGADVVESLQRSRVAAARRS